MMVTYFEADHNMSGRSTIDEASTPEKLVHAALGTGVYPALRGLSCEVRERMAILSGMVPSFYQKQLAQEIARKIDGIDLVVNRVVVQSA